MTPLPLPPPPPPPAPARSREEQEAIQARLDRLARRRAETGPTSSGGGAGGRKGRRHPAQGARIAALGLSLASTTGLTAFFLRGGTAAPIQPPAIVSTPAGSGQSASSPEPASAGSAPSASRVVDGAAFQNRWGVVQVEATFSSDGTMTAVDAIQSPDDRSRSISINSYAVPQLDAEAVQLQSAAIHTVSGATYTSSDYRRSLQSAIDLARDAQLTVLH